MIQYKKQVYHCPSGDKSHSYKNRKEFIAHLISCSLLKSYAEQNGLEKSGLMYYVCPKNFLHLKLVKCTDTISNLDRQFCSCQPEKNEIFANFQEIIQFGENNMDDYIKFLTQVESPYQNRIEQDLVIYQDLESNRIQYIKGQGLKNNIQHNKTLYFTYCNELYEQRVQFKFVKEYQGMREYLQKHQKIDQLFEIIPPFKISIHQENLRLFQDPIMSKRIIMEVQVTNKNSYSVQKYFEQENFYTCVSYKDDILLMFKYDKNYSSSNQLNSLFIMKLDQNEYINHVEVQKQKFIEDVSQQECSFKINEQNSFKVKQKQFFTSSKTLTQKDCNSIDFGCNQIEEEVEELLIGYSYHPQFQIKELPINQINKNQNIKRSQFVKQIRKPLKIIKPLQNQIESPKKVIKKKIISSRKSEYYIQKYLQEYKNKRDCLEKKYETFLAQLQYFQRIKRYKEILETELNCIEQEFDQFQIK